jgi:hypothetical protein
LSMPPWDEIAQDNISVHHFICWNSQSLVFTQG